MKTKRILAGIALFLFILLPHTARAYTSSSSIAVSRSMPDFAMAGESVTVTLTVQTGSFESGPVRGLLVTDYVPAGLLPTTGSITPSQPGYIRETSDAGEDQPGVTTERWTLETPPDWSENNPVGADSTVTISYQVTIPADAADGTQYVFPGIKWVGMIAAQGDDGDHFGYEDNPFALNVGSPTEYHAEDAQNSNGVQFGDGFSGWTGTGWQGWFGEDGDFIEWTDVNAGSGSKTLVFRYAHGGGSDASYDIIVNGTLVASDVIFPVTGNWNAWDVVQVSATLVNGDNTVRIECNGGGGVNLDRMDLE